MKDVFIQTALCILFVGAASCSKDAEDQAKVVAFETSSDKDKALTPMAGDETSGELEGSQVPRSSLFLDPARSRSFFKAIYQDFKTGTQEKQEHVNLKSLLKAFEHLEGVES